MKVDKVQAAIRSAWVCGVNENEVQAMIQSAQASGVNAAAIVAAKQTLAELVTTQLS